MKTNIEWTEHSVNPFRARNIETGEVGHFCIKVSAGCANCYAGKLQHRFGTHLDYDVRNKDKVELFLDESKLQEVLKRKKPTKYFWCDMTDMFYEGYPDDWIDKCFAVMALTPQHTHQILTKRPERMREYLLQLTDERLEDACAVYSHNIDDWELPLKNVWLGVSVEDQKTADERIPILLGTPAAIRFISYEPALGAVNLKSLRYDSHRFLNALTGKREVAQDFGRVQEGLASTKLNWVIAGGESGTGARGFEIKWFEDVMAQCKAAGVPFFMKQLDKKQPIPEHLLVRQFPEVK